MSTRTPGRAVTAIATRTQAPSKKPTAKELAIVANAKEQHCIVSSRTSNTDVYACKLYEHWCKENRKPYIEVYRRGQKADIIVEYLPLVLAPSGACALWDMMLSEQVKALRYGYSLCADSLRFYDVTYTRAKELAIAVYEYITPHLVAIHQDIEHETNLVFRTLYERQQKQLTLTHLYRLSRAAIERHFVYGTRMDARCERYHDWCLQTRTPYIRVKKYPLFLEIEISLIGATPSTIQHIERCMSIYHAVKRTYTERSVHGKHKDAYECQSCTFVAEYSLTRTDTSVPDALMNDVYAIAIAGKLLQSVFSNDTEHQTEQDSNTEHQGDTLTDW